MITINYIAFPLLGNAVEVRMYHNLPTATPEYRYRGAMAELMRISTEEMKRNDST